MYTCKFDLWYTFSFLKMKIVTLKWGSLLFELLLITLMETSDGACPEKFGIRMFGENCKFRCRCKNNIQCDLNTGACATGCDVGWIGPGCQYENVALNKPSVQSSTSVVGMTSLDAMKATDGLLDTCTGTQLSENSWWRVDLGTQRYIVGLAIHLHKNEASGIQRRNNIVIYICNSTDDTSERILCYRETGSQSSDDVTLEITCLEPMIGQHVEINVFERSQLELCEVQIYGGRELALMRSTVQSSSFSTTQRSEVAVDGITADNDTFTCAQTRRSRDPWWTVNLGHMFMIQSIVIYNRLDAGKQGLIDGFYVEIDNRSSFDSPNLFVYRHEQSTRTKLIRINFLLPVSGQYVKVTVPGFNRILTLCEVEVFGDCPDGMCGYECRFTCLCNTTITGHRKINSTCPYGCAGRATGVSGKCDYNCEDKMWGERCSEMCGICANNESCDVISGTCVNGCQVGFKQTELCRDGCESGLYGENCELRCGFCANQAPCFGKYGTCQNRCEPGYKFPLCKTACDSYTWGINCNMTCGKCRNDEPCDQVAGYCPSGCGFRIQDTLLCDKGCETGFYGPNCNQCGNCEGPCDSNTGSCMQCLPGYQLPFCMKECLPGNYGTNCMSPCGHCEDGVACNHVTGECQNGCQKPWTGNLCDIATDSQSSLFGPPRRDQGTVAVVGLTLGGIGAFVCMSIMLLGLVLFCRRRKVRKREEDSKYKNYMIRHQLGVENQANDYFNYDQTTF